MGHYIYPRPTLRKPVPVGLEMKASACAASKIIVQLELQEGQQAMGKLPFVNEFGRSTASVMRLTRPFMNTTRDASMPLPAATYKVYADSAFASVHTAASLREHGLHFAGVVKTAHKNYPRAFLQSALEGDECKAGAHVAATTTYTVPGHHPLKLFAIGWKDAKVQTFIDTQGSNLPGEPAVKRRKAGDGAQRREFVVNVPRPKVVAEAHEALKAMYVHRCARSLTRSY
jgi:hypothetical protein